MEKEGFDELARKLVIAMSVLYLLVVVYFSFLTDTSLSLVFLGFTPLLLYMVAFFAMYLYHRANSHLIWVMPLVFPIVFLILWDSKLVSSVSSMEGPVVFVLNIMLSYAVNAIFFFLYKKRTKVKAKSDDNYNEWTKYYHDKAKYHMQEAEHLKRQVAEYQQALQVNKKNFKVQLRGIEDKCKAINFVIGRVYSDKNGGSKKIRDMLKIDRELYNTFSEITAKFSKDKAKELMDLLTKVYLKLTAMELSEKRVLGKKVHTRLDDGQRIIDVLNQHDKDPVLESHSEAKEVCTSLVTYLKQMDQDG